MLIYGDMKVLYEPERCYMESGRCYIPVYGDRNLLYGANKVLPVCRVRNVLYGDRKVLYGARSGRCRAAMAAATTTTMTTARMTRRMATTTKTMTMITMTATWCNFGIGSACG